MLKSQIDHARRKARLWSPLGIPNFPNLNTNANPSITVEGTSSSVGGNKNIT